MQQHIALVPRAHGACGLVACRGCFAARAEGRRHAAHRQLRTATVAFAEADDQLGSWQGSQQDLRAMWDSVPRPLLRVGKAGATSQLFTSAHLCSVLI